MKSDDTTTDTGDDLLAGIDLQAWRVPPPSPVDRSSLLVRALAPATTRAKRPRITWLLAGIVLLNVALAAIVVVLLSRPAERTLIVQAPAGGSVDAQVRDLLKRLEQEQRALEEKLAEIRELRALVIELSEKVRLYEQQDRRERTVPKQQRDRQLPVDRPAVDHVIDSLPVDPYDAPQPPVQDAGCDEVSCVLGNFSGACCVKFRRPPAPKLRTDLPEGLDRVAISEGIAAVKGRVAACGSQGAKGKVKVKVRVAASGAVTNVEVEAAPDAVLARCVASAIQKAVFPQTQLGGSFSYPFVF
jgi:ABC-type multidrug transport system fused ATPase/permease subunit